MTLVDGLGCWAWADSSTLGDTKRPALFLDRDGVVISEGPYLRRPHDVALLPTAAETIGAFNDANIPVVMVTNQSGIARGYLSWRDFEAVQAEIDRQLDLAGGASVNAVFACGFHDAGRGDLRAIDHPWRKPNAGMLLAAAEQLHLALEASWIVGDRASDLAAGREAGLAGGLHVRTGHANRAERKVTERLASARFQVRHAEDLAAALQLRELIGDEAHAHR